MEINGCGQVEGGYVRNARLCDGCAWSSTHLACEDFRNEYGMSRLRISAMIEGVDVHE